MGDSLSIVFATLVAAIIMFLFPMLDTWERQDDLSYMTAYTAVVDFVDATRNTGRITDTMYDNLVSTINATGNRFTIQMEHREYVLVPKKNETTGEVTGYEMVYLTHYTDEITNVLDASGEYIDFNKGDFFYVSIKNSNKTQATMMKQSIYATNLETFKIGVPYGGQVKNEYK